MKLTAKFNLIFVVIFGLGLLAIGLVARSFLYEQARGQVIQQARLMMDTATSARLYTAQKIRPLLDSREQAYDEFAPESVPAYAAISLFANLKSQYPDYSYREATLNPTNPSDRSTDWEADVIRIFRQDPAQKEFIGVRDTPNGSSLYLAKPMKAVQNCMRCHSEPSAAPASMLRRYGSSNGFGWKVDEIVAAQIVSVPLAIPESIAQQALVKLVLWLLGVALVGLVLLNVALDFAVLRPVRQLAETADAVSQGNLEVPELVVKGKDEVSLLAASFNRMHRSMVKAMKMLEE